MVKWLKKWILEQLPRWQKEIALVTKTYRGK